MNKQTPELVIQHTKNWLETVIIGHNICPFAKRVFDAETIHYEVIESAQIEEQLQILISTCQLLDINHEIETSLLIYPQGLDNFDDYLDFLALANALLEKQGYEGIYQLASFHPEYCFEGVDANDASNYTNRAPYPTLHIIQEASLEKVLENYSEPEKIPLRNIEYTRQLGQTKMQNLLDKCTKIK